LSGFTVNGTFDTSNTIQQDTTLTTADVYFYDTENSKLFIGNISGTLSLTKPISQQNSNANVYGISSISYQKGFTVGNTISQIDSGAEGYILGWDSELHQLTVNVTTNSNFTTDSVIIESGSNNSVLVSDTVLAIDAPHHYKNQFGEYCNRLNSARNGDNSVFTTQGKRMYNNTIVSATLTTTEQSTIQTYGVAGPVSIREFETELNENRRSIKILKPEYVQDFIEQFQEKMG
jgi:hypothetical protein